MTESQTEVMDLIQKTADNRNESVSELMDSSFGSYWNTRFYRAEPDVQEIETSTYGRPLVKKV